MTLSEIMKNQEIYYETMYILRPDIAEEEVNKHIEKYNKLLETMGGKILDSQMRGKRRLAYPISNSLSDNLKALDFPIIPDPIINTLILLNLSFE